MFMNKKFGAKVGAKFITYAVNTETKEFESKWFPMIEFGGQMALINDGNGHTLRFDTRKEALKEARAFLKRVKEKYPEDFAS
jgi:hypothetical protein